MHGECMANLVKKNRQRVGEDFNSKGFPLREAILAKMAYLSKMVNMANIWQSLSKNSKKMAKELFESGDFDENGEMSPKTSYSNGCMCRSENNVSDYGSIKRSYPTG